jgi:hypothetical protein
MRERVIRRGVFILGLVLALTAAAAAQVNISNSPGTFSTTPRISTDSLGNAHVVWVEQTGSRNGDVFYSKGSVSTLSFSPPIKLSNSNTVYCETVEMCDVAVDGLDRVYVVWVETGQVLLRVFNGTAWETPIVIASSSVFDAPRVAASNAGDIYLAFWNNEGHSFSRARVGGAWEDIRELGTWSNRCKMADIAVGGNFVGACWVERINGIYQAAFSQRGKGFNASWSDGRIVAPMGLNQQHAVLEVDGSDVAHVVWTTLLDEGSGMRVVHWSKGSASGFTAPQALSANELLHYPFMAERQDDVFVAWQVGGYGAGSSVDYNILSGGQWSGSASVPESSGCSYVDVAATSGREAVYFVWDSIGEIKFWGKIFQNPHPALSLSRNKLQFGAVSGGPATRPQKVLVANTGTGSQRWTAASPQGWILVSPASGAGSGQIEVGVNPAGLSPSTYQGVVLVADPDAPQYSPKTIAVTLVVYGTAACAGPFGVFDTPAQFATIRGSAAVTGWALDDVGVQDVKLYRDPVGSEPGGQLVYIGEAVFVEGARPDVEQAFPGFPACYGAGWGYMLLSNFLPNGGNGTFTLRARATDKEGRMAELGSKTIVCANASDTLPFGAIDTPIQGGTASGAQFANFGWALTQSPKLIPTDGSTITVWVDGQPLGHPSYGHYREDIARLFPGYANANGAIGYLQIDTTPYPNGLHTIAWSVKDNGGNESGVGSRYFQVLNSGSSASAMSPGLIPGEPEDRGGLEDRSVSNPSSPVFARRGYDLEMPPEALYPGRDGVTIVPVAEVDRLEIWIDKDAWERGVADGWKSVRTEFGRPPKGAANRVYRGFHVVGGEFRSLPAGASLDRETGVFTWQLGPGFIGDYEFVFWNESLGVKTAFKVRVLPKS